MHQLLAPLTRLALARGLPYTALDELLRAALVREARRLHADVPGHGLVSRVSTTTGLTRREVSRLLEAGDEAPLPAPHSLTGEVLVRWMADPLYQRQGRPLALPRTGDAPSFEALAQSVTRDVHPRTLLAELCRLELVTCNTDIDTVALKQPAFVPRADQAHMLSLLADNVGDHLRAAVDNVLGSGDAHFEQAVYADELSLQSVQALRPLIAAQWADLLGRMAPELERRIADDRTERRAQDQRVRIGFYSFAAPTAPRRRRPTRRSARARKSAGCVSPFVDLVSLSPPEVIHEAIIRTPIAPLAPQPAGRKRRHRPAHAAGLRRRW